MRINRKDQKYIDEFITVADRFATYIQMKVDNKSLSDVTSKNQLREFKQALDNLIGEIELVD